MSSNRQRANTHLRSEDWRHEPDRDQLAQVVKMLGIHPAEALKVFGNLAKAGSAASMLYIGYIHRDGLGTAADVGEAERWFRMATDAGSISAHYSLGNLYGRLNRMREAREAFAIAGANEYGPALNQLGRMYAVGRGVEKDVRRARQYLERASTVGHLPGRIALARLLVLASDSWSDKARGFVLYLASDPLLFWTLFREGYASEQLR
jgi:TPR repeat protein